MPVFPHHSSPSSSSRFTLASNNPVHPQPNIYQPAMIPHVSFPCRLAATLPMLCLFCGPGPSSLFILILLVLDAPFMRYASDLARKADSIGRFGRKDKPLAREASNLVGCLSLVYFLQHYIPLCCTTVLNSDWMLDAVLSFCFWCRGLDMLCYKHLLLSSHMPQLEHCRIKALKSSY